MAPRLNDQVDEVIVRKTPLFSGLDEAAALCERVFQQLHLLCRLLVHVRRMLFFLHLQEADSRLNVHFRASGGHRYQVSLFSRQDSLV